MSNADEQRASKVDKIETNGEIKNVELIKLDKLPLTSKIISDKSLESPYIQNMELDPSIVKDVLAKENQDRIDGGGWYAVANGYIDETTLIKALQIDGVDREALAKMELGGGYYDVPTDDYVHSVALRHVYGDSSYIVHSILSDVKLPPYTGSESFNVIYSDDGSDLIAYGDHVLVRDGKTWSTIPDLKGKTSLRFFNSELDERKNTIFYFTDEEKVYAMYGARPYEGCCTIMTENIFVVDGADPDNFSVKDQFTARDNNNIYKATMSEKGGVELLITRSSN